ncbi:NADPH-dependent FMN reductase [Paenibacillus glycanilyticus]|uniref:FMN reductase n=1 Tax=Paenibacillus glycanilyticus TaxID=126569 RepID=A0ABQ6GEC9_9BACL|nr:NADPH-dependent FMN reductase [Paenibacillus glycanilyticus]GLX69324.1 FMN reductase [Paenibacillus glycanilyticus]
MEHKTHVFLGISGSLRKKSSNTWLLSTIEGMMPAGTEFRIYQGLASLPHFNPDLDGDEAESHEAVHVWREELREADAIVICTPEYARGVPGSLKNALDWVVSSGEFMNKPTAVISASPHPDGGATALQSLALTLKMMSASIPEEASIAVPFVSKIIGPNGSVTDNKTLSSLLTLVRALSQAISEK